MAASDMTDTRVAFVTTAHAAIGTGHLRRCITLAEELRNRNAGIGFFVYAGDVGLHAWLEGRFAEVVMQPDLTLPRALEMAGEWAGHVVVDSYDVGAAELSPLLDRGAGLLVMDDLADRPLPATWLLNSCVEDEAPYRGLSGATLLLGPKHALLRPQFQNRSPRTISDTAGKVVVTVGGSDPLQQTARVLRLLDEVAVPLEVRVLRGAVSSIAEPAGSRHRVTHLHDVQNMAEQMEWADVAISGAGQTLFELAACGCPALGLQVADNQRFTRRLFSERRTALFVDARTAADAEIVSAMKALIFDRALRSEMSRKGQAAVDGGGAARVADILTGRRT